jgi:MATE family multidrug resistance protein
LFLGFDLELNFQVEQASERMRKWGGQEEQQLSGDSNQINILTT